jgi:formate hydrogenlyase subunit 4
MVDHVLHVVLLLVAPPLVLGVIHRVKARFAGRRGAPVWQPYADVWRLLHKGAVYSRTTSWVFRAGPVVSLAAVLAAGLVLPLHGARAPLSFAGDVILYAYLMGLARLATMAAALDTGSSFEGMGASREAAFSALAEPALFLSLAAICIPTGTASFEEAFTALSAASFDEPHPWVLAAAVALFVVLLAENSRVPVDDPNTHLELTMVHEVMVLDHSGPDYAFIVYGAAVKLFVTAALFVHAFVPIPADGGPVGVLLFLTAQIVVAVLVGVVESVMARLRLPRVPQFLLGASVIAVLGLAAFYAGRG